MQYIKHNVIVRECGQTLGRVRVMTAVIISLQWTKGYEIGT